MADLATYKEINAANPLGTTLTALKGDGTDETTSLLNALNYVADNHLTLYIPKNMTVSIDSLSIVNKSNFGIRCEGTIKRLDNSPTVGALIKLDTCSNVVIPELNMDGNGANNGCVAGTAYTSSQEQKHSFVLTNCTNVRIDNFYVLNPSGDGIYIGGNTNNVKIQSVSGHADTQIGRNLVSIVNAQDIFIDTFFNDGIGHYDMPGGLDIEPNNNTDIVRNVFINSINIRSNGTNLLSILATNNSIVENIFIDKAKVTYLGNSNSPYCVLISASDVQINQLKIDGNGYAKLLSLTSKSTQSKNIFIKKVIGKNGYKAIEFGFDGQVQNVEVNGIFTNLTLDGIALYYLKNAKLNVDIDSVGASRYMVNFSPGTGTIDTVTISGNISKRGTGIKAVGTSATSDKLINIILDNLDFTGWAQGDKIYGAGLQAIMRKTNCPNLTHQATIPSGSNDQWKQGDIIWNNGTDNTVAFWRRLTTGTGNVLNTDWKGY